MASGYIRTVSNEEIESLKLSRVVNDSFTSFSRAAEADRRGNEDLFADHVQAIGHDKRDWIIYAVIVLVFRENQCHSRVLTFAVAPGAQDNFENYVTGELTKSFEALKLAWLQPDLLWIRKPDDHRIPREEVEAALTTFLVEKFRPDWDSRSRRRTDWHLRRERGLRAWARHEAHEQLKVIDKPSFNLENFRQTELRTLARGKKIRRLAEWLEENPCNIEKLGQYLQQTGIGSNPLQKALCIAYDRAETPVEFWCSKAISQFLSVIAPSFNRPKPSEDLTRQWLHRLDLKLVKPSVVLRYHRATKNHGEKLEINQTAAWVHGLQVLFK